MPTEWSPRWPWDLRDDFAFFPEAFRAELATSGASEPVEQISSRLGMDRHRSFHIEHLGGPEDEPYVRLFEVTGERYEKLFEVHIDNPCVDRLREGFRAGVRAARLTSVDLRVSGFQPDVLGYRIVAADGETIGSMASFHLDNREGAHQVSTYLTCYALADELNRTVFYNAARPSPDRRGDYRMDLLRGADGRVLLRSAPDPEKPGWGLLTDVEERRVASVGPASEDRGPGRERAMVLALAEPIDALAPVFLTIFNHHFADRSHGAGYPGREGKSPRSGPGSPVGTSDDRQKAKERVAARQAERARRDSPLE